MDDDATRRRLRASYEAYREAEEEAGREAGRGWAADHASWEELKLLEEDPAVVTGWDADDWERAIGPDRLPGDEFTKGFAEGALEVWNRVKP